MIDIASQLCVRAVIRAAVSEGEVRLNLSALMMERFPRWLIERLFTIGHIAECSGWRAFIVGGFVRDLILGKPNLDIDIMVEGDGIALARELSETYGAKLTVYERFFTATLHMPDGRRIDIATCRRERYERPAVLPEVEPASAEEDLLRRDFSINAIAVHITPSRFGDVLDVCRGIPDLQCGLIRILHERSFIDDPTRAFRAVRFEQRFSFKIELQTEHLMRDAIKAGMISLLTRDRIKHEWIRICYEPNPAACIFRMAEFDMLRWIDEALSLDGELKRRVLFNLPEAEGLTRSAGVAYERWLLYLMPLIDGADFESAVSICRRYSLSAKHSQALLSSLSTDKVIQAVSLPMQPSAIKAYLDALPVEVIAYAIAKAIAMGFRRALDSLITYLKNYINARPDVTGSELISAGIPAGPWIGAALREALKAKLDEGCDKTRQLEVALKVAKGIAAVVSRGAKIGEEGRNTRSRKRDKIAPDHREYTKSDD
ncbi:MAG: hypothetical protein RMK18_06285 [Armatimonadota bacterium]|nr:hypothetical protein [Armatimonadota bacterium]MCX7777696.1 hypothetical protein [Armatimonadota bacterium]MDW8025455.1 hypothetical protein [Armatimonadota bacterium]